MVAIDVDVVEFDIMQHVSEEIEYAQ
jgi:hypothetical protein